MNMYFMGHADEVNGQLNLNLPPKPIDMFLSMQNILNKINDEPIKIVWLKQRTKKKINLRKWIHHERD